ncbi:unnamed protein product [Heligmosomoides polygyrus]|uniref:Uncharacterized protein n=1 Tax=Heligmosomoides polygyrus TaxID=6339 RepID=A0A183GI18_HELPZ|nr:unnamed protein product [Heligmosomoides polygyrus]
MRKNKKRKKNKIENRMEQANEQTTKEEDKKEVNHEEEEKEEATHHHTRHSQCQPIRREMRNRHSRRRHAHPHGGEDRKLDAAAAAAPATSWLLGHEVMLKTDGGRDSSTLDRPRDGEQARRRHMAV